MYPPFNTSSGTARPSKDDWRSKHAPLTLESLELQYRLESADGLQQQLEVLDDAAKYMEEGVVDWNQKNQLLQSLKEILQDRETLKSEDVQKCFKKMEQLTLPMKYWPNWVRFGSETTCVGSSKLTKSK